METILNIQNISKSFGETGVLDNLSLDIAKGRFVTLLGPSGCGKTTTIRIIAGLETPDSGSVILNGEDVTALPPDKRRVNTVFQNYALFPHLSVFGNIAYGLKIQKMPKDKIAEKVNEILDLVALKGYENRMESELSGGQRQRVAIARALVLNPEILLLDEPLGALDLQLRRQMQKELKAIQTRLGITFIYITHDQEEAMSMSDHIVLMNEGKIMQQGSPREIYKRPSTEFAASFLGEANILHGTLNGNILTLNNDKVLCAGGKYNESTAISVRPSDIILTETKGFTLKGNVKSAVYTGSVLRVLLDCGEFTLTAELPGHDNAIKEGQIYPVSWNPEYAHVIGYAEEKK